ERGSGAGSGRVRPHPSFGDREFGADRADRAVWEREPDGDSVGRHAAAGESERVREIAGGDGRFGGVSVAAEEGAPLRSRLCSGAETGRPRLAARGRAGRPIGANLRLKEY